MDRRITSVVVILLIFGLIAATPTILENVPKDLIEEYGVFLVLLPIGAIIIILIIALIIFGKKKDSTLKEKRQALISELQEAERQFLKHKIDKKTFDDISTEKHQQLIKIEAEIDAGKKQELSEKDVKKIEDVSADKKRILKDLFEQKMKKAHELNLAEQNYLKRKIDEETYIKISSDIKKEMISLDGQINSINTASEIEKVKEQLKSGAREVARQKQNTKERGLGDELEEEVIEQLNL
jgi:hypothetical protein